MTKSGNIVAKGEIDNLEVKIVHVLKIYNVVAKKPPTLTISWVPTTSEADGFCKHCDKKRNC